MLKFFKANLEQMNKYLFDDYSKVLDAHYDEAKSEQYKTPKIHRASYAKMFADNRYHMYFITDEDDNFYGYLGFILMGEKEAHGDAFYLHPEARGQGLFSDLVKFAESDLYHNHGKEIFVLFESSENSISKRLTSLGYSPASNVKIKKVRKG